MLPASWSQVEGLEEVARFAGYEVQWSTTVECKSIIHKVLRGCTVQCTCNGPLFLSSDYRGLAAVDLYSTSCVLSRDLYHGLLPEVWLKAALPSH